MSRRKRAELGRADEIREQAKEVAGRSGEALKEFAEQTGSAAKDFAVKTRDAAKDLVESIERAAQGVEPEESRRGRKLIGAVIVLGVGAALVANEKLRHAIGGAARRRRTEPEPWEPRVTETGNGEVAEAVPGTTEQT